MGGQNGGSVLRLLGIHDHELNDILLLVSCACWPGLARGDTFECQVPCGTLVGSSFMLLVAWFWKPAVFWRPRKPHAAFRARRGNAYG